MAVTRMIEGGCDSFDLYIFVLHHFMHIMTMQRHCTCVDNSQGKILGMIYIVVKNAKKISENRDAGIFSNPDHLPSPRHYLVYHPVGTDSRYEAPPPPDPLPPSASGTSQGPNHHRDHHLLHLRTTRDCIGTISRISNPRMPRTARQLTKSLPLIPVFLPAAFCASFAFFIASCSASFLSILVFFQIANVSGVTGVKFGPSLCLSTSKNSSSEIVFALAASSNAFFCDLRTKPGGRACRY